ncbi:MAG: triple tyrosine motif-containing protein [Bacteroidetes bacterium]|nr:triple tyrosine motif-containing protein [Bacteroidota bacterium]
MHFRLTILICLLTSYCLAQQPALYFDRITTEQGLSNNQVNCILQDKRGFLWFGTNDGLNRYDGHYFSIYRNRPGDSTSISGNIITGIIEDENGVLWITSADGGLSRYDYKNSTGDRFKQFKHIPRDSTSIPTNAINKLLNDKRGFLWMVSNGYSVIRFNKQTQRFDRPVKSGPKTALDLAFDANGTIWVGRQGGGILKIDPATLRYEYDKRYEDLYARLPHVVVTALFRDRQNNMWYGSWDKFLYRFDPLTKSEFFFKEENSTAGFVEDEILSFAEDGQGRIWIGGKTKGLQLYDRATGLFSRYEYNVAKEGTLSDNTIRCIYTDRSGNTWLGTGRGISVYHPEQQRFLQTFLPVPSLAGESIRVYDFFEDETGDLWIGTSAGLYIKQVGTGKIIHRPLSYNGVPLTVSKFFTDSRGIFYLGTSYSLFIYDRKTGRLQLLPNTEKDQVMNRIIESRVVSLVEDSLDGRPVLIASPYGHYLAYYDLQREEWISRRDTVKKIIQRYNIKDNLIRKLYKTQNGELWLATTQEGIGKWAGHPRGPIQFFTNDPFKKDGLSNNNIYDIAEDKDQNLWISTYGGGLNHLNTRTGKIVHIPAMSNLLEGIATDADGNVWMIANGHLQFYNIRSGSGTIFPLPDIDKSGGVSGYISKDKAGKMYVAGKNYFISFHPDSIKLTRHQPEIFLTDFKIFNDSYSSLLQQQTIKLEYRQNYFTVQFSAPEYSITEPVQYSYMMEGLSKEWVDIGDRNYVTFANLGAGSYTFRVRATNTPGSWSTNEVNIRIVIVPPFWKRTWFYILVVLLITTTLFTIYRYRVNELLKRQAIRNKIAQDLHDNLGSTLSSISVYSQVARIHGEKNETADLDVLLEKISNTSNEMITEMNDIVWAINPRNDSMEKIIQRMESFAKPLAAARNIRFVLECGPGIPDVHLNMDKRKNFYLIFKEAVNNAIKYSGASQIQGVMNIDRHQLLLEVTDDGLGFNPETEISGNKPSLSGNGLQNMQKRAAELDGKLDILSVPGKGTTIRLRLPLG